MACIPCLIVSWASISQGVSVDLPRLPAASPDGKQVAFCWRGDIWKAPADGGAATRLTSHLAEDSRPVWSGDGTLIAFTSNRGGSRDIWVMDAAGGALRQVTDLGDSVVPSAFVMTDGAPSGVLFDAALEDDLYRAARPYIAALQGGQPPRLHDAFGTSVSPSPDGRRFLFERGASSWLRRGYRGSDQREVWLFDPAQSPRDQFVKLTSWEGNDGWARWRGNDEMVFLSDREDDTINLYSQPVAPHAAARRLTQFRGRDVRDLSVSADGSTAFFTVWDTLYRLDLRSPGVSPLAVAITASADSGDDYATKALAASASEVALNPDGKTMAFVSFGDVWVRPLEGKSPARRVTAWPARESGIAWSADGGALYFASDRDDRVSIWKATVDRTKSEVRASDRPKPAAPAVETTPAPSEAPAVVEPASTEPTEPPAAPAAAEPPTSPAEPQAAEPKAAVPEPDDTKPAKPAEPKAEKPASERWVDAVRFALERVATDRDVAIGEIVHDELPSPSPDGKMLAFRRGRGDLMLMDLASGTVRLLRASWDGETHWRWSPDSKALAVAQSDQDYNADIWIVPVNGSAAVNVTRHPDNDYQPRFSADGRMLALVSERTNEELDIWMVFLDKRLAALPRHELEAYFKDAAEFAKKRKPPEAEKPEAKEEKPESNEGKPAAKEAAAAEAVITAAPKASDPPQWSLDDAYRRMVRVTSMAGNEGNLELSGSGERVVFTGGAAPGALLSVKLDGTDEKKLGARAEVCGLNLAGDSVVLLSGGKGQIQPISGGEAKSTEVDATVEYDRRELSRQKFLEMARIMDQTFYHQTMKDLPWADLTAQYLELAQRARTGEEFDDVANRLLGELNASHTGVHSPAGDALGRPSQGRLGVQTKPVADGFEVASILPEGPAATAKPEIRLGDVITAIEFESVAGSSTVDMALRGRIGRETVVSLRRTGPDAEPLTIETIVEPVSSGECSRLAYRRDQVRNAQLVNEWSGGRLGYIHIAGMGQLQLDEYERDLYAAAAGKDGLVIDVRNNGGGSTADLLLASLMVQPHAYAIPRGGDMAQTDSYPQDRLFIQRCTLPISVLCNEKSFSNAEIFAHAIKTLKRGTLVGQQTYGGVISTGGTSLLDGTSVRLPGRGWYLPDGTDMENHGAMPDVVVEQTPQDEAAGTDAQLRAAVDDLLERLSHSAAK